MTHQIILNYIKILLYENTKSSNTIIIGNDLLTVDLMNQEAAKTSTAIETQAMTSSRPRTPSSVHMTASRVVDISNFKESRFSCK